MSRPRLDWASLISDVAVVVTAIIKGNFDVLGAGVVCLTVDRLVVDVVVVRDGVVDVGLVDATWTLRIDGVVTFIGRLKVIVLAVVGVVIGVRRLVVAVVPTDVVGVVQVVDEVTPGGLIMKPSSFSSSSSSSSSSSIMSSYSSAPLAAGRKL